MDTQHIFQILHQLTNKIISESTRRSIQHWLIDKQDMEEKDRALFQLWNEMPIRDTADTEIQNSLKKTKIKSGIIQPTILRKQRHILLKYAAILLFPILTGLTVWMVMKEQNATLPEIVECYVPNGKQQTITLPDGTEVQINSGSLFVYPQEFKGNKRQVYLSGEAHFNVKHNKKSPFIIRTGPLDIKVLGTCFNVESYPENKEIITTLVKGSVKVYKHGYEEQSITMAPNDRLVYNGQNNKFDLYQTEARNYTAWTHGEIRFDRQNLFSILKTIERRYNVSFIYDSTIDLSEKYTMKFKQYETIEEVMQVFTLLAGNITYTIKENTIFLQSNKKGGQRL